MTRPITVTIVTRTTIEIIPRTSCSPGELHMTLNEIRRQVDLAAAIDVAWERDFDLVSVRM